MATAGVLGSAAEGNDVVAGGQLQRQSTLAQVFASACGGNGAVTLRHAVDEDAQRGRARSPTLPARRVTS